MNQSRLLSVVSEISHTRVVVEIYTSEGHFEGSLRSEESFRCSFEERLGTFHFGFRSKGSLLGMNFNQKKYSVAEGVYGSV